MSGKVGRNDPCPCGSGKKFKRCCSDVPRQPEGSRAQPGSLAWTPDLTLLVDTSEGPMLRRVPRASPLPANDRSEGHAAESATHRAAAMWGLPDFVFLPDVVQVG